MTYERGHYALAWIGQLKTLEFMKRKVIYFVLNLIFFNLIFAAKKFQIN